MGEGYIKLFYLPPILNLLRESGLLRGAVILPLVAGGLFLVAGPGLRNGGLTPVAPLAGGFPTTLTLNLLAPSRGLGSPTDPAGNGGNGRDLAGNGGIGRAPGLGRGLRTPVLASSPGLGGTLRIPVLPTPLPLCRGVLAIVILFSLKNILN